jgi:hypothetical protein
MYPTLRDHALSREVDHNLGLKVFHERHYSFKIMIQVYLVEPEVGMITPLVWQHRRNWFRRTAQPYHF